MKKISYRRILQEIIPMKFRQHDENCSSPCFKHCDLKQGIRFMMLTKALSFGTGRYEILRGGRTSPTWFVVEG